MSLKNQLNDDMKTAMRNKDSLRLSTIRLANAAIKQFEVDERQEADDAKITAILTKMIKQRKDSAKIYQEANRLDLTEKEEAEIEVLQHYLPEVLDSDAILREVQEALAATGATSITDMGKVMSLLKTKLAGKADMGEVNKILKAALSQ